MKNKQYQIFIHSINVCRFISLRKTIYNVMKWKLYARFAKLWSNSCSRIDLLIENIFMASVHSSMLFLAGKFAFLFISKAEKKLEEKEKRNKSDLELVAFFFVRWVKCLYILIV
jgi:hypothetical protein